MAYHDPYWFVANLTSHRAEPFCEIHPSDALKFGVRDQGLAEVRSKWGSCVLRVTFSSGVRRGQILHRFTGLNRSHPTPVLVKS